MASTSTLDQAFSYLPPGLGLSIKGHSAVFLDRDDFELPDHHLASHGEGPTASGASSSASRPAAVAHLRNSSTSSLHTNLNGSRKSSDASSSSGSSSDTNPTSSPTSSLASSISDDSAAAATRRKWLAEGEDPGLGAARRALWEDPEEPKIGGGTSGQEEACAAGSRLANAAGDEGSDDDGDDSADEFDDIPVLPPVPSPSRPAHATLLPLPSCLRPPILGRSMSSSSQSSSATSVVQFAPQPQAALTYSPGDYERRGQGPVEKLSIKEWVELKSVREAIGLYSGKIPAWNGEEPPSPTDSQSDDASYQSHFASASGTLSPKRSCGQLAAGASGILTVGVLANRETC